MWLKKTGALLSILITVLLTSCRHNDTKSTQGYIEGRFTYIASSVSGHLEHRRVDRGQKVAVGEELFALDPMPEQAELEQAQNDLIAEQENLMDLEKGERETKLDSIRAQIEQAQSDLALAKITLKRQTKLYKKAAVSTSSYDEAHTDYLVKAKRVKELQSDLAEAKLGARENIIKEQKAKVAASKATIKQLRWQLSQKTMSAPINGIVFDTFYRRGEYVPAADPVLALLAPKNIYLIFYVPEALLSSTHVGQTVHFNCDGCQEQAATIYYISPTAEYTPPVIYTADSLQKLVYRIEARIPLDKALSYHPGQPVDVTLRKHHVNQ